jgi:2-methylisocitrate lyase-like PEP mutase family enzyme
MPSDRAATLRRLHAGPSILVLPNAWDVASARVFETAGFPAVATTSAGVAFALGYPDGQRISRDEMAEAVRRIATRLAVPVTADMEAGYGPTPEAAAATARAVVEAGAVGMNLEDSPGPGGETTLLDPSLQMERIGAAREAAAAAGVPIVINARTDVFLAGIGEPASRLAHTVRRMVAYREAGADCVFVPGVYDAETIAVLVREAGGPLNILAGKGCPPVAELQRLGVRRLSIGSGAMRAGMGLARRIAEELRGPGTYQRLFEGSIPHAELNRLLER